MATDIITQTDTEAVDAQPHGCYVGPGISICYGPRMVEVKNEKDGDDRWCFRCRKVREFRFIITSPIERSYYGPSANVQCGTCNASDGDLFPGRYRMWGED
ncbi:hypothetical protein [Agrococcus sp. DT81.2]|uniref:hypothetical protein n=1 Tax=Agrococcus sp. DT81.2 TaxID=3393414 RepID=UPI003CE57350